MNLSENIYKSHLRGLLKKGLPLLCLLFIWAGAPDNNNEYEVKAMFLYNFTKYIEWPAQADSPVFRIAISGNSEIAPVLQSIAAKKSIGNKKIEIVTLGSGEFVPCQILFIPKSENSQVEELARKCQGKGVLVITDECRNAPKGAAINLVKSENKIRFDLYMNCARTGGIKISSQLTSLALTVYQ